MRVVMVSLSSQLKLLCFYNGNISIELCRVRNRLALAWLLSNTSTKYYGLQYTHNKHYTYGLWGAVVGGEVDFALLHIGLKVLSQSNSNTLKWYIIPNMGISWGGTICAYYGYKLRLSKLDFTGNTKTEIGVRINFTKHLIKEFKNGVYTVW